MDIVGMGVDLADVARVRRLLRKDPERFRARCFTDHEWAYADRFKDPSERLAARFAGKEAVMKSLGAGWRIVPWKDIEITGGGQPTVRLSGKAAVLAESLGVRRILVTITHTNGQALVMALSLGDHAHS